MMTQTVVHLIAAVRLAAVVLVAAQTVKRNFHFQSLNL